MKRSRSEAFASRLSFLETDVVVGAGAVAGPGRRVVAPQGLDRVLLAVVPGDVVEPAGNGRGRRQPEGVADPRALVTVLVAAVVVPAAQGLAVDDVLGSRVGHGLLHLVPQDDGEAVQPAGIEAGVHGVLAAALAH